MKGLTPKQRNILDYIQKYISQHKCSPSYREIMHHFSLASPGSVYKYIRTLTRKGVLNNEKKCSRSLTLAEHLTPNKITAEVQLPFIGNITMGHPIEMFVQSQTLNVPTFLVPYPEHTYILRAEGDSLNEEYISDGDLLLVEARQEAQAGEMIIGLINNHDTLVKRYFPEGHYIRLEGHTHQPLILRADNLRIQGVLVGLLRAY